MIIYTPAHFSNPGQSDLYLSFKHVWYAVFKFKGQSTVLNFITNCQLSENKSFTTKNRNYDDISKASGVPKHRLLLETVILGHKMSELQYGSLLDCPCSNFDQGQYCLPFRRFVCLKGR